MIATTQQIRGSSRQQAGQHACTCKPLDLPNWIGRRWMAKTPFCTVIREGATWRYGELVDMGALLEFAGWAGTDRGEPFASFVSPDKPGCVIFLREKDLARWCRELPPASTGELVKVRIADANDECGQGEERA